MKKLLKLFPIFAFALLSPVFAFAQTAATNVTTGSTAVQYTTACPAGTGIGHLICTIQQILHSILPVIILIGVVYFVWGVVQYVIAGGEEAKAKGRDHIIYGIIGLAIIFSLMGLVNLVVSTLGFGATSLNVPTLVTTTTGASTGATCTAGTGNIQQFLGFLTCLIDNSIIPFIFALAVLAFIWGALNYFLLSGGEEEKRSKGKQFMIWGIIALTVMMCVWGLVGILGGTFSISTSALPHVTPPASNP